MLKTDSYCTKSEMIQNQGYGFSLSSVTSIKFHFFSVFGKVSVPLEKL